MNAYSEAPGAVKAPRDGRDPVLCDDSVQERALGAGQITDGVAGDVAKVRRPFHR